MMGRPSIPVEKKKTPAQVYINDEQRALANALMQTRKEFSLSQLFASLLEEEDKRLKENPVSFEPKRKETPHGTVNGYVQFNCRCEDCKQAASYYRRSRRNVA
jgi:hypothetical protein